LAPDALVAPIGRPWFERLYRSQGVKLALQPLDT
jgi:hypothetical protein